MTTVDNALEVMMRRVFREELHAALALCDAEEAKAKGQAPMTQAQPATTAPAEAQQVAPAPPATPPINEEEERAKMHGFCKRFISQFGREAIMDIWKKMGVAKFSEVPIDRYLELSNYLSDGEKTYQQIKGNGAGAA